jgi:hypothetical protein
MASFLYSQSNHATYAKYFVVVICIAMAIQTLTFGKYIPFGIGADFVTLVAPELSSATPIPTFFRSEAHRCPLQDIASLSQKKLLKSQQGEDQHLLSFFNGLCGGTYLEMGALDGRLYSNSFAFHKALDWKGLLVELTPESYLRLVENRPSELAVVNAAVCDQPKKIHYYSKQRQPAVSGVWEFAPTEFRELWWPGITLADTQEIDCRPLREIIATNVGEPAFFDFFSFDIEGSEFMALQGLDFSKVGFGIIFIERQPNNPMKNLAIRTIMERNGYIYLYEKSNSVWFVNAHFDEIYKDVIGT